MSKFNDKKKKSVFHTYPTFWVNFLVVKYVIVVVICYHGSEKANEHTQSQTDQQESVVSVHVVFCLSVLVEVDDLILLLLL